MSRLWLLTISACLSFASYANAADWTRFRGPNGLGVSEEAAPVEWSEDKNLKWKVALPGPGLSSPIVVGDKIFVTSWSGYGTSRDDIGEQEDLRRHLVCVNRNNGTVIWSKSIEPVLPEEPFRGMFAENGYASHTPVSDGEHVYAFFGKTGVIAFDMEGNQLWKRDLGREEDRRHWGSASSPILWKDLLIVPATTESQALVALNKTTGEVVWQKEAKGFGSTWSTPVIVDLEDGTQDLVMSVPYEFWGFDPATGKLLWYCESVDSDSICSSVVAHDGVVYAVEGRSGGAVAVKCGGRGDVTSTHVVWSGRNRGRIGTPIYYNDRLYWINSGIANCLDAKTGEEIYRERVNTAGSSSDNDQGERGGFGGGPFGGFGRGGRGGGGGQSYSSPVVAGNKMYYFERNGTCYVVELGDEFKLVNTNRFDSDESNYSGTPAISNGELFIRSNEYLYCVANE